MTTPFVAPQRDRRFPDGEFKRVHGLRVAPLAFDGPPEGSDPTLVISP
jgi:hypothetical protein